ncbi:transporter [Ganoderma sinense ZZ0214-1]|uniref:Transporter n=1 Tax=Ganoderma sinense ZZ0214-1 TaxID=1077348 RepID=A0A2G8RXV6_9APHY|nr:transporter [Ganoderma sinense ZZ0214-1]
MAGGNQALEVNPPNALFNLSRAGSDWLWAVFSLFGASLLAILGWTFFTPRGMRLFHQIAIVVITVGCVSYFSMASDLGATPVLVEFRRFGTRQIWYVHYIQWFISFPLLLLELLLATGLSLSDIFTTLFMSIVMVIMGLVGALVPTTYKWGYFAFGAVALFYIWYVLLWRGPRTTFSAGGSIRDGYNVAAGYLSFLLLMYPICWALSEGSNIITVTAEMIWFGILDLLAGPVFLFFFLYKLRGVDYAAFGLQSGKYTDTETVHSHSGHEKSANGHNDVRGNGNTNAGNVPAAIGGPSMPMPVPVPNPV